MEVISHIVLIQINMKKAIALKQILKLNPKIDKELLKKTQKLSQDLQKAGLVKREYNLASPYSNERRVTPQKSNVHLKTILVNR